MPSDATEPTAPRWLKPGEVPSVPGLYWMWYRDRSGELVPAGSVKVMHYRGRLVQMRGRLHDHPTHGRSLKHIARLNPVLYGPIPEPDEDA